MLSNMPSHDSNEGDALDRYVCYKHETICLFSCIDLIQNRSHKVISSIRDFFVTMFSYLENTSIINNIAITRS